MTWREREAHFGTFFVFFTTSRLLVLQIVRWSVQLPDSVAHSSGAAVQSTDGAALLPDSTFLWTKTRESMCTVVVYTVELLANMDTNGAEESVVASEVSSFQRLKRMREWYLGWEKVSCLERCPQFRSVLIERFHCST